MATPLFTQCFTVWLFDIGKSIYSKKLVEWPVVDSVPALFDVL